ncbi:hypothetical protein [Trinickia acidisoli]|uniref:hypothetical protein n=1 Tax=Trinickia acidisoli TaxID=2767482 RepID=UPI001A8D2BB9|nr:hypothetical protein [Trinickia acidisoli]
MKTIAPEILSGIYAANLALVSLHRRGLRAAISSASRRDIVLSNVRRWPCAPYIAQTNTQDLDHDNDNFKAKTRQ